MNHYKKNGAKRRHHFITALLAITLIANAPHAQGQESTPNSVNQCTDFGLTTMPKSFVGFGTRYWNYLPNDNDAVSRHTLSFITDEPRMLIEEGALIQTHLPNSLSLPIVSDGKAVGEYVNLFNQEHSQKPSAFFYTVRMKAIKPKRYQSTLGYTTEITGFAYVTELKKHDDPSKQTAILRVEMLSSELSKQDRLIPHHCYFAPIPDEPLSTSTPKATKAKIIALIGATYYIQNSDQSSIVLIDQGSNDGLMVHQQGTLIENTLSIQTRRKPAAQVHLLRVYANHSVAEVTNATAEIAAGQTIELSDKLVYQQSEK